MTTANDPATRLPRALRPLRHPAYLRLSIALVLSLFTQGLWIVAVVWQVIELDGTQGELSFVATAGAVGMLLPILLAGVVADRVPQKLIIVGVEIVHVAMIGAAALLGLTGVVDLWHLAALSFVGGAAMAFYYPAYSAWLPSLVPAEDLLAVNGIEGMLRPTIAQAAGPAAAGAIVAAASPAAAMSLAAILGAVGVLVLLTVPLTPVRREAQESTEHPIRAGLTDMREGFSYMVRTPWLLATLLFASLMILLIMGPLEVLVPFLVKDKAGGGAQDHALIIAAFGVGGAVGSMVTASFKLPRRYLTIMVMLWGAGCLPFVLIGTTSSIAVMVASAFVLGVTFGAPMVIWGTLLQRRVPPHLLGRVSSLDFFVSLSLMPVSMAIAGPVSEAIGMTTTFILAGTLPTVFAIVAIVWAKLPADEIANPLDAEPDAAEPANAADEGSPAPV